MSPALVSFRDPVVGPGGEFYDAVFGYVAQTFDERDLNGEPIGAVDSVVIFATPPTDQGDDLPVFSIPVGNVAGVFRTEYIAAPVSDQDPLVYDCTAVGLSDIVPEEIDDAVILPLIAAQDAVMTTFA